MKPFTTIAVVVFAVVALVHLWRAIAGWEVVINGYAVPISASWIGLVVAALLAAMVWRESRGS
jgi:uncharacterized membrane protein